LNTPQKKGSKEINLSSEPFAIVLSVSKPPDSSSDFWITPLRQAFPAGDGQ
jgi:hypothetical protein